MKIKSSFLVFLLCVCTQVFCANVSPIEDLLNMDELQEDEIKKLVKNSPELEIYLLKQIQDHLQQQSIFHKENTQEKIKSFLAFIDLFVLSAHEIASDIAKKTAEVIVQSRLGSNYASFHQTDTYADQVKHLISKINAKSFLGQASKTFNCKENPISSSIIKQLINVHPDLGFPTAPYHALKHFHAKTTEELADASCHLAKLFVLASLAQKENMAKNFANTYETYLQESFSSESLEEFAKESLKSSDNTFENSENIYLKVLTELFALTPIN